MDFNNLVKHDVFTFISEDVVAVERLWELKQEMKLLAESPVKSHLDFHNISKSIYDLENLCEVIIVIEKYRNLIGFNNE